MKPHFSKRDINGISLLNQERKKDGKMKRSTWMKQQKNMDERTEKWR
jgi:hypothetical protein